MKKYYYSAGLDKFGPFTLDELKTKGISRETKIWFDELGDWREADSVPELKDLFILMPPAVRASKPNIDSIENMTNGKPPKNWLVESILATIFCCMPFGIAGIVYASKVESHFYAGNIAAANQASADAKKWTLVSILMVVVIFVLFFGAQLLSFFFS